VNGVKNDTIPKKSDAASHQKIMLDYFQDMEFSTRESLQSLYASWSVYKLIGLLFLSIALIKSFGYTFARVVYKKSPPAQGNLSSNDNIHVSASAHYTISSPGRYYLRCGAQPSD